MSQELPSNKNTNEEVDLIVFFNLIGNVLNKVFKFFSSLFKSIFNVFFRILEHFYKQAKWYGIALVAGLVCGYFIDNNSEKMYGANMFINTNFQSTQQVYENIKQLNELANNDFQKLTSLLKITVEEASSLDGFYVKPDTDENEIMTMFVDYKSNLDSLSILDVSFKDFKNSLNKNSFRTHQIGVTSTNKEIFSKLNDFFPNLISENTYLNKMLKVEQDNFKKEEATLKEQIKINDSITKIYLKIRAQVADKKPLPGSGTNLYMGNAQKNELLVDESILINKRLIHENRIREVLVTKTEKENIISVISAFPDSGYDIQEWQEKSIFKLPLLLLSLLLLMFSVTNLGKFLKSRDKTNNI